MAELSPLFVLLTEMRRRWEKQDWEGAVALAKLAAPYLHGRAAPVRVPGELASVGDDELETWGGGDGAEASAADQAELP